MNKIKLFATLLFATIIIFSACKKYDEGPALSLKSKTDRLKGEWHCEGIYKNGEPIDSMTTYSESYILQFYADQNGISYFGVWNYYFTWYFSPDKESILWTRNESNAPTNEMQILRLTFDEFWYISSADNYEYKMIKNEE